MSQPSTEQRARQAKAAYAAGDYLQAAELFAQAAHAARTAGDELLWAEWLNNQSVSLLQADDAQAALDVLVGTPEAFERAGRTLHHSMAIGNRAAALDALGRVQEAEQDYRDAAARLDSLGEHDLRADVLKALSALQLRGGRQLEALATMKQGVDGMPSPGVKGRLLRRLLKIPFNWLGR